MNDHLTVLGDRQTGGHGASASGMEKSMPTRLKPPGKESQQIGRIDKNRHSEGGGDNVVEVAGAAFVGGGYDGCCGDCGGSINRKRCCVDFA